jgi:Transposase DDE domain
LDTGYDVSVLAHADLLLRLAKRRRLYRAPAPYPGRGRPCKHGAAFRLHDPTTQGEPDHTLIAQDPAYGQVQVDAWEGLHDEGAPTDAFTVVRVQVEHLPHRAGAPAPLWLAWLGAPLPADLLQLWRWYQRRFAIEHGFRFLKQALGWTTVRLRSPQAADRWSWLLAAGLWQLWLARPLVAEVRLPWDRPLAPEQLTPGRVRRAFPALLSRLSSPTRAPRSRGKSPGRRPGQACGPRERFAVVRRTAAKAARRRRSRRRSVRAA